MARSTRLLRPARGRLIAGVCIALARRFDLSPTLVRVLFVLSCILLAPQVLLCLGLWLIIPSK
jgi:phage shock protein PspC (stress-responsive transcriptional regulator)